MGRTSYPESHTSRVRSSPVESPESARTVTPRGPHVKASDRGRSAVGTSNEKCVDCPAASEDRRVCVATRWPGKACPDRNAVSCAWVTGVLAWTRTVSVWDSRVVLPVFVRVPEMLTRDWSVRTRGERSSTETANPSASALPPVPRTAGRVPDVLPSVSAPWEVAAGTVRNPRTVPRVRSSARTAWRRRRRTGRPPGVGVGGVAAITSPCRAGPVRSRRCDVRSDTRGCGGGRAGPATVPPRPRGPGRPRR